MFKIFENAKNLRWHAIDRRVDGIMRHPTDTPSWRFIDELQLLASYYYNIQPSTMVVYEKETFDVDNVKIKFEVTGIRYQHLFSTLNGE
ncbi:uncharacterized protein E5676_scaffold113G00960 [Cucumis melo var. makuwa]|uniref:Uncharacterized protein n=1 Tax=Cucumis melo var. makuwa TaxID=1194695 RepID=A0A5A7UFI8_CUCMM|nr:uncharacterized protein E6C27_scaffold207G001100 [Cucumis melo var. makuwa]TYK01847.1 uncharacterized protein E5676_scaffold113G00960 [Cucumis melo var. makuwa]